MELTHSFTVPGPLEETWDRFGDIAALAECFPGAQVTSVTDDSFEGTVKVKLGPIALVYAGSGSFVSKDEAAHSFVVEAKGRDKRGNGTAGATVTVAMSAGAGDADATDVEVRTDLSITGKPAQFGRGVMQDVSDKLLGQFVACLEQRLGEPTGEAEEEAPAAAEPVPTPPTPAAPQAAAEEPAPTPSAPAPPRPAPVPRAAPPASDDAIDLGTTVLPVIAKAYWKPALGGLAVLLVILWWVFGRD